VWAVQLFKTVISSVVQEFAVINGNIQMMPEQPGQILEATALHIQYLLQLPSQADNTVAGTPAPGLPAMMQSQTQLP